MLDLNDKIISGLGTTQEVFHYKHFIDMAYETSQLIREASDTSTFSKTTSSFSGVLLVSEALQTLNTKGKVKEGVKSFIESSEININIGLQIRQLGAEIGKIASTRSLSEENAQKVKNFQNVLYRYYNNALHEMALLKRMNDNYQGLKALSKDFVTDPEKMLKAISIIDQYDHLAEQSPENKDFFEENIINECGFDGLDKTNLKAFRQFAFGFKKNFDEYKNFKTNIQKNFRLELLRSLDSPNNKIEQRIASTPEPQFANLFNNDLSLKLDVSKSNSNFAFAGLIKYDPDQEIGQTLKKHEEQIKAPIMTTLYKGIRKMNEIPVLNIPYLLGKGISNLRKKSNILDNTINFLTSPLFTKPLTIASAVIAILLLASNPVGQIIAIVGLVGTITAMLVKFGLDMNRMRNNEKLEKTSKLLDEGISLEKQLQKNISIEDSKFPELNNFYQKFKLQSPLNNLLSDNPVNLSKTTSGLRSGAKTFRDILLTDGAVTLATNIMRIAMIGLSSLTPQTLALTIASYALGAAGAGFSREGNDLTRHYKRGTIDLKNEEFAIASGKSEKFSGAYLDTKNPRKMEEAIREMKVFNRAAEIYKNHVDPVRDKDNAEYKNTMWTNALIEAKKQIPEIKTKTIGQTIAKFFEDLWKLVKPGASTNLDLDKERSTYLLHAQVVDKEKVSNKIAEIYQDKGKAYDKEKVKGYMKSLSHENLGTYTAKFMKHNSQSIGVGA